MHFVNQTFYFSFVLLESLSLLLNVLFIEFDVLFSLTAIGNAFAVLSDTDKRRRYDQFGDENPQPQVYRDRYDYARGFEG